MNRTYLLGAAALALTAAPALAKDGVTADERGITLESGDFELNLGGRLHLDAAVFDDPATGSDGVTDGMVRRARLELSGKVADVVRFRVDREFAGGARGWRNLWASLEPVDGIEIKGGNMIVPFSGEDLQSSNTLPFAERSLASALAPGFGLGGSVTASGRHWSLGGGWFTDAVDNEIGQSTERGKGVAVRASLAPVAGKGRTLHFAAAAERRTFSATESLRFTADPGSTLAPNLMSSGGIGGIGHSWAWTAEAAASFGPVLLQAQTTSLAIHRPLAGNLDFSGQTLSVSWLVTGGRYGYSAKGGVFSGPDLKKHRGAVELAARYSRLDLRDGAFDRGVGEAVSLGANWYVMRNLRLMATWTEARVRFAGAVPDTRNHTGVARLQISF